MNQDSSAYAFVADPHDVLLQLGTHQVAHSDRTLYEHLRGVEAILRAWGQSRNLCNAGLFHSIYSTEQFKHETLTLRDRPRLQILIGDESERLVYLFSVLQRYAMYAFADSSTSLSPEIKAKLPGRSNGNDVVPVSGDEIAKLILLHLANRLDQATKPVTGIGFWLSFFSDRAKALRKSGETLPAALTRLGTMTFDEERRLHSLYLQGIRFLQQSDPQSALPQLERACRECGFVGEPYIMLAVAQQLLRNFDSARRNAAKGRELLESWGSPWHKRLSMLDWLKVIDFAACGPKDTDIGSLLSRMVGSSDPVSAIVTGDSQTETSCLNSWNASSQAGASRFFVYLEAIRNDPSRRAAKSYPGIHRRAWHDPAQFPVACDLESHFTEIKEEALKVQPSLFYEEAEEIGRTGSWQVCMFYEQGRRNGIVCEQCPTIVSILDRHCGVRRSAGLIYLSVMTPHTYIAPHRGHSNIRLRCHLAISIPAGDCALRVGNEVRRWEEGRCLIFDDTYEHEVWNRTEQNRLVLLIDLWHPDLSGLERDALETVEWLGMSRANEMLRAWNRNDAQRKREGKIVPVQGSNLLS